MTDKQINIIKAALELFAEKGFAATTTSQIARRAQVGEGTIFHHYKTKKDLLLAIPDYLSQSPISGAFIEEISKIIEQDYTSFEEFLRAVIQNRKAFASTNMTLIKVLFQEVPFHPELRARLVETILSQAMGRLVKAIDKFKAQGQIVDIPSETIVNLIFTSVFGYIFMRHIAMFELNWDTDKETDYLVQYIMNGICRVQREG